MDGYQCTLNAVENWRCSKLTGANDESERDEIGEDRKRMNGICDMY